MRKIRLRTNRVEVYLSDKEFDLLTRNVKKSGLSREAYMRSLIQNIQPKTLPPMDLSDALRKLDIVSNNMNQVAVKAHTLDFLDAPLYQENSEMLQGVIADIMRQIYR